jgi:hypothetical protein
MNVAIKDYGYGITLTTKTQDGKNPASAAVKFDGNKSRTFLGQGANEYALEFVNELISEYRYSQTKVLAKVFSLIKLQ